DPLENQPSSFQAQEPSLASRSPPVKQPGAKAPPPHLVDESPPTAESSAQRSAPKVTFSDEPDVKEGLLPAKPASPPAKQPATKEDSSAKQPPAKAHSSVEEERPPARPASPPVKQPATKAPPPFLVAPEADSEAKQPPAKEKQPAAKAPPPFLVDTPAEHTATKEEFAAEMSESTDTPAEEKRPEPTLTTEDSGATEPCRTLHPPEAKVDGPPVSEPAAPSATAPPTFIADEHGSGDAKAPVPTARQPEANGAEEVGLETLRPQFPHRVLPMAVLSSKVVGWLRDWRLQALMLLALSFLLALLQYSISWGLLCLCELLLFHFVPKRRAYVDMVLLMLPCLVFITYLVYAIALSATDGDIFSDMFFMVVAVALWACQFFSFSTGRIDSASSAARPEDAQGSSERNRCCCICCGCCGVVLGISLVGQVVGLLMYLATVPKPEYTETGIAYWCLGEPNKSLVVLEPGYLASPGTLYFVQHELAKATRACIYDPVGTGFSAGHAPSFRSDAAAMKDVVNAELATHADSDSWQIVVGGHSRGHLTACRFWLDYSNLYDRLAVLGFDGSHCGQTACNYCEDFGGVFAALRLLATPFWTLFSGLLRLTMALFQEPLMQAMASRPVDFPDYPPAAVIQLSEPYFWPKLWRSQSLRGDAWLNSYDGPTWSQCWEQQLTASSVSSSSHHHLYIDARGVCTEPWSCAEHMSIISSSWFANIASAKAVSFVAR
ncbi:unc-89, partial [Symbiodinium necroappetens]